jgi:hypothetical protein
MSVGAVRNEGAASRSDGIIIFLDSDVVVPVDHVARVKLVMATTGAHAVGRKVGIPNPPTAIEQTWHRLHLSPPETWVTHINSGNLAVKAQAFHSVGGFDGSLPSGEDAEFCLRLHGAGYRLYQSELLEVVHLDNPRSYWEFFRKEEWRGRGMLGTVRLKRFDLPFLATIAHCVFSIGAVVLVAGWIHPTMPPATRWVVGTALSLFTPSLAIAYRVRQGARSFGYSRALWLYWLYLSARALSIPDQAWRAARRMLFSRRAPGKIA